MKKSRRILVLLCLSSVLWSHLANADQSGFSGEIAIGGAMVTGRLSQLDAEEGEPRSNGRDQQGDKKTYLSPDISGELNYTLSSGRTTLFMRLQDADSGLSVGLLHATDIPVRISMAATFNSHKVWQDPYRVDNLRRQTDKTSCGVSLDMEEILGTGLLINSRIQVVDVEKDRIGEQEKSLRRDGYQTDLGVGYAFVIGDNQQFIPKVSIARSDMQGEANSNDGITASFVYEWGSGPWGIEAGAGFGWNKYRKAHPLYNKHRKATVINGSALAAYAEPFGWPRISIYGLAAYSRVDENIDFFDSDLWTFGLGAAYAF